MKIFFLFFFIVVTMKTEDLFAQIKPTSDTIPENGIYMTYQDFLTHKISQGFDKKDEGYKIKLPKLYIVKITTPVSTTRIDLRHVWGFRKNREDWIYKNKELYQVLNHDGIWIYSQIVLGGEGGNDTYYYFSKTATSEIIWLSRKKIREAYSNDSDFLSALNLLKWYQPIDSNIPPNGQMRVVELYNICHRLKLRNL